MFGVLRSAFPAAALAATIALAPAAHAGSLKDDAGVVVDWSGAYVGIHAGGAWSQIDNELTDPALLVFLLDAVGAPTSSRHDVDGFLAGGHAGIQRQFGHWVIGAEASFSGGKLDGRAASDFGGSINFGGGSLEWDGTSSTESKISNLFTVVGRLGYAWDRWHAYAKGGFASAEIDVRASADVAFAFCGIACIPLGSIGGTYSSSERHNGFVVGAGLEYMITQNVVVGLEYSYTDLEAKTHNGPTSLSVNGTALGSVDSRMRVDPDAIHAVTARLSFKFGGPAETYETYK
jgi:outer membrane immunogenic protein